MSFLFGKKKSAQNALPPATRDIHTPGGSSIPTANGVKPKDRVAAVSQTSTPGSSINNSIHSIGRGAHTPSPDQGQGQGQGQGPGPTLGHGYEQRGGQEKENEMQVRPITPEPHILVDAGVAPTMKAMAIQHKSGRRCSSLITHRP
jgi:hypothetical protein